MTYSLRQRRDGAIELVDGSPAVQPDGKLSCRDRARSAGRRRSSGTCGRSPGSGSAKGLFNWAIILGAFPGLGDFATMTLPLQATIVAFACFDLLAAVGLWLAAPWGGAIWLLCAVVEAASPFLSPRAAAIGYLRRRAQHRSGRRLFPSELARGARARLSAFAVLDRGRTGQSESGCRSVEYLPAGENLRFILILRLVFTPRPLQSRSINGPN